MFLDHHVSTLCHTFAACALTALPLSTQLSCCHCTRTRCFNHLFTITLHTGQCHPSPTQLAGVNFEVKPESEGSEIEWNPDTKTLRIPLSAVEGESLRRTKLVIFTCNKCGECTKPDVGSMSVACPLTCSGGCNEHGATGYHSEKGAAGCCSEEGVAAMGTFLGGRSSCNKQIEPRDT